MIPPDALSGVGEAQPAVSSSVKVKFVAATSAATAVLRKTSCARFVVELRRSTDVQPAGGQMYVPVPPRAVTWAIIWSSTARPAGFVITSVEAPPALLAGWPLRSVIVAGSITYGSGSFRSSTSSASHHPLFLRSSCQRV